MKTKFLFLFAITVATMSLNSCTKVAVNGDEEAVLIMKPFFFGHGGVDDTPVKAGLSWAAPTTDYIKFKTVPQTFTEQFDDMITDDNTPVDFNAYLKCRAISGQTPLLYKGYGDHWYENSIAPKFRAMVRDKASTYKMFDLAGNREVLLEIEKEVFDKFTAYVKEIGIPIEVQEVTVGAVTPPLEVLEETRRTAAQNQSELTQIARAKSELARKGAEVNKAIADNAYKDEMGMTTSEYLQLRHLEIEKEKVELVRDKQNVTIVMGQGLQPMIPINPAK